ncbi:hypothetical protein BOTBODRAFT_60907 [Botryobasidium botryosum FD-172 SS1]|uniref:Uncharacterized protein n=1 Tax=Botryobasidium botryosum (strain FD-172 SS1) TaxID=930990 RepID=A0A067LQR4_BOTB1|nr:hypothetical protein BOTBODRAFT_60907 [Botryobasidium botryosum FD-172 SS1]
MTALPSFCELLSSLGMPDHRASPAPDAPNPAIVVSHSTPSKRAHKLSGASRYSPYHSDAVYARRNSLPTPDLGGLGSQQPRPSSTSPRSRKALLPGDASPNSRFMARRPRHLVVSVSESAADTHAPSQAPISALLRGRSPQASPTSAYSSHSQSHALSLNPKQLKARRPSRSSNAPMAPMSIPALSPVLIAHFPSTTAPYEHGCGHPLRASYSDREGR